MARGIQKGDLLPVHFYLIGTNMLGDSPRFGSHYISLPDSIKKPGLPMINMPHNGNYRRAWLQLTGLTALKHLTPFSPNSGIN
jgi:hypothetical protein